MKILHIIAFLLLVVGGLNWGLIGLGGFMGGDWNVVHMILGMWPAVEWIVYVLVGLSAAWLLFMHKQGCKMCSGGMKMPMGGGM